MNEKKIIQAKLAKLEHNKQAKKASNKQNQAQHNELLASISALQGNISALEASLSTNGTLYTQSQKDLAQNFTTLKEILENGLNVTNIKDIKQAKNQQGQEVLELTVKNYHPNTGEELQPQVQQSGTKEQIEAQLANMQFLLSKFQ